jgi:hypothetical protein
LSLVFTSSISGESGFTLAGFTTTDPRTNKRLHLTARLPGAAQNSQALDRPGLGVVIAGRPAGRIVVACRAGGS